jgi:retron-type reverse transcriptase
MTGSTPIGMTTWTTSTRTVEWLSRLGFNMKSYTSLYKEIISFENLILAWKKARKGKTRKGYVIEFEQELFCNLMALHYELKYGTYKPKPLVSFVLRDPKTRVISKSDFRDRIVHYAIINVLEPIFDKTFIYDSCANRTEKGNLFALKRFDYFKIKVSKNGLIAKNSFRENNYVSGYCLKADIKHYFQEVDIGILIGIIKRKIADERVIWLIGQILNNTLLIWKVGGRTTKRYASWEFNFSIFRKCLS